MNDFFTFLNLLLLFQSNVSRNSWIYIQKRLAWNQKNNIFVLLQIRPFIQVLLSCVMLDGSYMFQSNNHSSQAEWVSQLAFQCDLHSFQENLHLRDNHPHAAKPHHLICTLSQHAHHSASQSQQRKAITSEYLQRQQENLRRSTYHRMQNSDYRKISARVQRINK